MRRKDALLKIRISEELKLEAEKIAQKKGETLSVVVREALRQYLEMQAEMASKSKSPIFPPLSQVEPPPEGVAPNVASPVKGGDKSPKANGGGNA